MANLVRGCDFFKLIDFHAVARFCDAMIEKDVAVAVAAERFDFSEDFLGGHRIVFFVFATAEGRASMQMGSEISALINRGLCALRHKTGDA